MNEIKEIPGSKVKSGNVSLEKQLHLANVFKFASEQQADGSWKMVVATDKAYQKLMHILEKNKLNIL